MLEKKHYKVIGLSALGGTLECYDFTIYALFAPFISQHFFSNTNHFIALINTFAVFALGYLARPIGGILFGHLGDKIGRKYAFSLAIFIMAVSTLLMGCLPSYQSIGILSPLLLIALRLLQGFSVGGEIPGAVVFTMEHISLAHRGLAIGIIFMSITLGNTLAGLIGFILTTLFSSETMFLWGWRIPFILGFVLGIVSFIIRINAMETPEFMAYLKEKKIHAVPFFKLLKTAPQNLLHGFLLTAISASTVSLFLFLPTYLSSVLHLKIAYAYLINIFAFLSFALMSALFGWVTDHFSRNKLMLASSLLLIVFNYPLFEMLGIHGNHFIVIFILSFSVIAGILNGCYGIAIAELFPTNLRYSGVGFSYNLGYAIFGGMAPLLFTFLIHFFSNPSAPSFYLIACAFLTLIGATLSFFKEKSLKQYSDGMAITQNLANESEAL